jgi:hypothetical protein
MWLHVDWRRHLRPPKTDAIDFWKHMISQLGLRLWHSVEDEWVVPSRNSRVAGLVKLCRTLLFHNRVIEACCRTLVVWYITGRQDCASIRLVCARSHCEILRLYVVKDAQVRISWFVDH